MHPLLLNTNISQSIGNNNPTVYSYAWVPYYGWYGQGETYGSQNGLTYLFPMIRDQSGVWGPSRSELAAGRFPTTYTQGITEGSWPGVGFDKWTAPFDIDWNTAPLNTATGYIGFTFGNVGHIGLTSINEIVSMSRWIPQANRIYDNSRHYRGIDSGLCGYNRGIGYELIYNVPSSSQFGTSSIEKPLRTPWLKRKFNFIRKELQNIMQVMGNTGFYLNGMESDDEYYIYWDFRNIGATYNSAGNTFFGSTLFGSGFLYPNNSASGNCWYASYTGICAAPDYLITRGITSFRSYLLTHGFTTNPNSSKFVDGLTALGSISRADNISASGSRSQSLGAEYAAALTDWTSMHWADYVEDFKRYNGLCADNSFIGNYGYFRTNVGVQGYTYSSLDNYFTGLITQSANDYFPYPDTPPTSSSVNDNKTKYYSYNYLSTNHSPGNVQTEVSNNFDSIYTYGAIISALKVEDAGTRSIDRQKLFYGNSYSYGSSFGIYSNYNWQIGPVIGLASGSPIWWLPANYLNSNAPAQTFNASLCYEVFGLSAAQKFDPTGINGSRLGSVARCGDNKVPQWNSWHLNPVWGITAINATSNYGPANYIPTKGPYGLNGLTMGSVSRQLIGNETVWTTAMLDSSGFPYPGNTLPAGTLYKHYWSHWYPMAFMALNYDVNWGRQVAVGNVYRAVKQREGTYPGISGSNWNGIQRPINVWIQDEKLYLEGAYAKVADNDLAQNLNLGGAYFEPTGLVQGYYVSGSTKTLVTQYVAEAGVMYYENIRHQYLNKAGRYTHWNPYAYSCVTSATGGQVMLDNKALPVLIDGLTMYGVCGAITMRLGRKLNTVIGDCNTRGNGMVYQTVYLAPGNDSERSYLMSGAQKVDGQYLWRITFANPATDPSPIIIRGACSGVTTAYNISGVTDYINNPNNKFGVWWTTGNYEVPIVENPPIPEALRRGIVNLPENPKIMYNATRNPESRNAVPIGYQNPDIFCMIQDSPYGYWRQTEQWGSNNGLTYMWPSVIYSSPGRTGPSKASLNAGIFPIAGGADVTQTAEWAGVGSETNTANGDIRGATAPWNSATGYIGFTFGSTGFITTSVVDRIVADYSWIPNKYRVFYPSRIWRWVDNTLDGVYGIGITGSEQFLATKFDASAGATYLSRVWTPWIKRKINFARAELKAFYLRAASLGFTMAHWECDDEYSSTANWDFRSIGQGGNNAGDPEFYRVMLYPNFSPSGSTWYANFYGSSAAPDSLITEGITSMEAFLLTRGFTSNPSGFRYVRGLTAVGNVMVQGNVAAGGSPFQYLQQEYQAALQDWIAYMWTDCVNDFKQYNGISADNSLSGNYYYARTNVATKEYMPPSYNNPAPDSYLTKNLTRSGNDYIPYPNPSVSPIDADINVTNYYGYNNFPLTLTGMYTSPMSKVGDIDNMNFYGVAQLDQQSNAYQLIDRNLDVKGNSYKLSNSGVTFGKGTVGWYDYATSLYYRNNNSYGPLYNDTDARKWLPEFYLGSCAPAQIVICRACAETLGNCGFFKFDPTGAFGSSAANKLKVGFDRTPHYLGWHLNPVWGINVQTFNGGATIGPANYAPILQKQIISSTGLTYGCISRELIGGSTSTTTYTTTGRLDNCGNPFPGNTLPAGTLYNQYWTHWYPMAFMALLGDVKTGRHMASVNVATAKLQINDPVNYPGISGSNWNKIQKPINSWISHPYWSNLEPSKPNSSLLNFYFVPKGITFNYELTTTSATGVTFVYGEASPMYYENMRHQYLNKTGRFSYWNPPQYTCTTSISTSYMSGVGAGNFPRYFPQATTSNPVRTGGFTYFGVCGAMAMNLARPINTVLGELQTKGNGIVWETIYLAPVNMDERSYLISGAQKVDGDYLWRITFAHPATQSPIIVRGSVSGITTAYNISGITDYINNPNSKFGIWWTSDRYEVPIVENPPVSEAERLGLLNLPDNPPFEFNPLTMTEANIIRPKINAFAWQWANESAGTPIYYVSGITQNWLPSSNDLTQTDVWPTPSGGFTVYSATEIAGPAGISAFGVTFSGSGSKFGNQRYTYSNYVTAGVTYTFSMYINVTDGLTQNFDIRIGDQFAINSGSPYSPRLQQIQPIVRFATTNNSSYNIGFSAGSSGWTRIVVNVTPQLTQRLQIASFQINGTFATAPTKPYYIAGLNFNEGSSPTDFVTTNIVPEIEYNQYGNTGQSVIYDGNVSSYLNFGSSNALTYIQPLADAYGALNSRKSWLSPTSKIKWRESQSLKRYVSILKNLNAGKRAIYPKFMSSTWLWSLDDDKFELGATGGLALTFYDNNGNAISRPLCGNTYHGGLWLSNGLCLGQNIWNQVMLDLSSQNAYCDYFIHNQELVNGYFSAFNIFDCTGNSLSIRNAIINNPKYNQEYFGLTSWASHMATNGACAYTIQKTVYDPALSYLSWETYGQSLFRKSLDVMVSGYNTYDNGRFANSIQTDAYSFSGDGTATDGAPSIFGFHPFNSTYVMGNAPSPILYGWYYSGWDTSVIYGTNMDKIKFSLSVGAGETRPSKYPIAWMPFLFDMQTLRLAKRGSPNLPLVPVIPSLRFVGNALLLPGQTASDLTKTFAQGVTAAEPAAWYADVNVGYNPQCGITFTQSGGNSAYFYELIRHACVSGAKGFDWWNNSSFWNAQAYGACYGNNFSVMNPPSNYVDYMKTGNTTYLQDMKYLNNVLDDCNTQTGGYTPTTYNTSRINYTTKYVVSGAPKSTTGSIWRVTVKPGNTLLVQGVTLPGPAGNIGMWVETSGNTLTGITIL